MKTPTSNAKNELQKHNLPLDAHSFYNGLILAGLIEEASYLSSTGSGEVKSFLKLTERGEVYGLNKKSGFHPQKTEPRFYTNTFLEVYLISVSAIAEHAAKINPPT